MDAERTIEAFAEQWGLDNGSKACLRELSAEQLMIVVQGFEPAADTRNVNAKLSGFIKSKVGSPLAMGGAQKFQSGPSPHVEVNSQMLLEFVQQWGLDERCLQTLQSLSSANQQRVLTSFEPSEATANINAKFMAWVKTIQSQSGDSGGGMGGMQSSFDDGPMVEAFAQQWNLDQSCVDLLNSLSPAVKTSVISDFSPPPETANVNAKLMTFAKKREQMMGSGTSTIGGGGMSVVSTGSGIGSGMRGLGGMGGNNRGMVTPHLGDDQISVFIQQWGLDSGSEAMLRGAPLPAQQRVISQFAPEAGTRNVNARFMTFIKIVISETPMGGGMAGELGGGLKHRETPSLLQRDPMQASLMAFIQHWRLDNQALEMMRSLPTDISRGVIEDFDPPPGTQNLSAMLSSFVKGRLRMVEKGAGKGANFQSSPGHSNNNYMGRDTSIQQFVTHWGLDAQSQQMLSSMPDDQLEAVFQNFAPSQATINFDAKLRSFVKANFPDGLGRGASPSISSGQKRTWDGGSAFQAHDLEEFCDRWRVDANCRSLLQSLDQQTLVEVMRDFAPDHNVQNISGKLTSFAKKRQEMKMGGGAFGSGGSWGSYRNGGSGGSASAASIDEFVARWNLDQKSRASLEALDNGTLQSVLTGFDPAPHTRNKDAKLAMWMRSNGYEPANGSPAKRARAW